MKIASTRIPDLLVIEPAVFGDERGFFTETYHQRRYDENGLPTRYVQDNLSHSHRGVIRGLHFQNPNTQAKLVQVVHGEIYDVCVDIRRGSPTFGKWAGVVLSLENKRQLFVPKGFAHGFCTLSETATMLYKCSDFYTPPSEWALLWSDPELGIDWPVQTPDISPKDAKAMRLRDIPEDKLPVYALS